MSMCIGMIKNDKPFIVDDDPTYSSCKIGRQGFVPSRDSLITEVKYHSYIRTKKIKKCKSYNVEQIVKWLLDNPVDDPIDL